MLSLVSVKGLYCPWSLLKFMLFLFSANDLCCPWFLLKIYAVFVFRCTFAVEVCYPPCGCFNDDPPFNTRPLPEGFEDTPITWLLYTQSTRNNPDSVTLPNIVPP